LLRCARSATGSIHENCRLRIRKRAASRRGPQGLTLEPGDIIFTGTPSGVGNARKPDPIWMRDGDVCEIEIEGVGMLRNPIVNEH